MDIRELENIRELIGNDKAMIHSFEAAAHLANRCETSFTVTIKYRERAFLSVDCPPKDLQDAYFILKVYTPNNPENIEEDVRIARKSIIEVIDYGVAALKSSQE